MPRGGGWTETNADIVVVGGGDVMRWWVKDSLMLC